MLIKGKADVNAKHGGSSALEMAKKANKTEIIKLLEDAGAKE